MADPNPIHLACRRDFRPEIATLGIRPRFDRSELLEDWPLVDGGAAVRVEVAFLDWPCACPELKNSNLNHLRNLSIAVLLGERASYETTSKHEVRQREGTTKKKTWNGEKFGTFQTSARGTYSLWSKNDYVPEENIRLRSNNIEETNSYEPGGFRCDGIGV